jgi:hypothetical protein
LDGVAGFCIGFFFKRGTGPKNGLPFANPCLNASAPSLNLSVDADGQGTIRRRFRAGFLVIRDLSLTDPKNQTKRGYQRKRLP